MDCQTGIQKAAGDGGFFAVFVPRVAGDPALIASGT
jgi:hypothetical protein